MEKETFFEFIERNGFVLVSGKPNDYSTMRPGGLCCMYKHPDGRCIFHGLHEKDFAPSIISPRMMVEQICKDCRKTYRLHARDSNMHRFDTRYNNQEKLELLFTPNFCFKDTEYFQCLRCVFSKPNLIL
jgi:hypothetical protein